MCCKIFVELQPGKLTKGLDGMTGGCIRGGWLVAACLTLLVVRPSLAQQSGAQHSSEPRTADGLLARQGNTSDFAPVRFQPASAPFPLRNNNYVAIKHPGSHGAWPGQTGADNAERFLLSGAAHGADALGAHVWGRAGEQKTDWTKPRPRARYGDCIAQPFDRNRCELVQRVRADAGSDGTGRCSDAVAPDRSGA